MCIIDRGIVSSLVPNPHTSFFMYSTVLLISPFLSSVLSMCINSIGDTGDHLLRRSTAGGPIAWKSKLQTTVATSSMQSGYQALYAGDAGTGLASGGDVRAQHAAQRTHTILLSTNPVYHCLVLITEF